MMPTTPVKTILTANGNGPRYPAGPHETISPQRVADILHSSSGTVFNRTGALLWHTQNLLDYTHIVLPPPSGGGNMISFYLARTSQIFRLLPILETGGIPHHHSGGFRTGCCSFGIQTSIASKKNSPVDGPPHGADGVTAHLIGITEPIKTASTADTPSISPEHRCKLLSRHVFHRVAPIGHTLAHRP